MQTSPPGQTWDEVVVGAGSAGAVLACRLSEPTDRRVLLLEAGPDSVDPATTQPLGAPILTDRNWDYAAYIGDRDGDARRYPYPVGKAVGGSSAVNGAVALRGMATDFDDWAAAGNSEWAWSAVEPFFQRIESPTPPGGSVPISRTPPAELDPLARAFVDACHALGLPSVPDLNACQDIGVGPVPTNSRRGRRMSSADTHLAHARHRPNLTLWDRCRVTRLLLHGGRAVGVEAVRDGRPLRIAAGRVTLAAGAVNTPVLLQRSGIGDPERLAALGIRPVADLPGVGENLADHPLVAIWAVPRPDASRSGAPWHSVMARAALGGSTPEVDVFLANNVANAPIPVIGAVLGNRMSAAVTAMLLDPRSRGRVFIEDADPATKPVIILRLASNKSDVERLMAATRLAWALVRSTPVAGLLERVMLWTERMVDEDALLRDAVRRFVTPMWHPTGTARMGPAADRAAVVDQRCRVHHVEELRVVDASVMPSIPRATPHLTCIMLAERVAGWMS